jgi:sulfate permease, SulP family
LAGIFHALTLLLILMFAAPLARFIPLAVLAAILLVVSYNMGEWEQTVKLIRLNLSAVAVWGTTFILTVIADLTTAVEFGMVMAALTFIRKVAETTTVSAVTKDYILTGHAHVLHDKHIPDYVEIYRIQGALLFGSAQKLSIITDHLEKLPPVVILRLRAMSAIDSTGIGEIEEVAKKVKAAGRLLVLCGAHEQPAKMMRQPVFMAQIGQENILPNIQTALDRAAQWVQTNSVGAKA